MYGEEFNLNTDNRRRLSSILGEEPGAPVPSAAELADRIEARLHAIDRAEIGARELLQKPVHRYSTAKDGTCGVHIQEMKHLVGHTFGPEVAVLHSGHVFGENALFNGNNSHNVPSTRNATIIIKENNTILA